MSSIFDKKVHIKKTQKLIIKTSKLDDKKRLDKFLSEKLNEISRNRIKTLIQDGLVTVDENIILVPKKKLKPNQKITVTIPPPRPLEITPANLNLQIIFEDDFMLVINKPAGIVVHPGAGNFDNTLVHGLMAICKNLSGIGGIIRPGIVHRLDKDTSGLLIVAKDDTTHNRLSEMFKSRKLQKKYVALIHNGFSDLQGLIDLPIGRHPVKRTKMAVNFQSGKPAKTSFKVIKNFRKFQYLMLNLHTGRTHQIRVHLSHFGCPILGDTLYGGAKQIKISGKQIEIKRQMLHAQELRFEHPITNKKLSLKAPLPEDFVNILEKLDQF